MSFYSDVEQVILHRSRESQGPFRLFKSSWYNIKHEIYFTLGLSIQNGSKMRRRKTNQSELFQNPITESYKERQH